MVPTTKIFVGREIVLLFIVPSLWNNITQSMAFPTPHAIQNVRHISVTSSISSLAMENRPELSTDDWKVSSLLPKKTNNEYSSTSKERSSKNKKKNIPTKLILHFDINETILLGDDAGGDSRHDSVQKMLAKSAFCQLPSTSDFDTKTWDDTTTMTPTHWWNGEKMGKESKIPPLYTGWDWPEGCLPYYRTAYKKLSKQFVDNHHGHIYRPVLEACEEALRKNSADNHILPAFYTTLDQLTRQNENFRLVFRTFGSDISDIAQIVTDFAQGKHPDYPNFVNPSLVLSKDCLFQGRWKCLSEEGIGSEKESDTYVYELWNIEETMVLASGDQSILEFLAKYPICGIRDDYRFWKANKWVPSAGKPIWIPRYEVESRNASEAYEHHLIFDDNIHNLKNDGIVCARYQEADGYFKSMDTSTVHQEVQGVHMIRVPTVEPVLNPNWYIEQIQLARERIQEKLQFNKSFDS